MASSFMQEIAPQKEIPTIPAQTGPLIGKEGRFDLPDRRTVITAAAIGGGIVIAGLVAYLLIRAKRNER